MDLSFRVYREDESRQDYHQKVLVGHRADQHHIFLESTLLSGCHTDR